ncbi:MAG TPA: hypothetical protein VEL76_32585 [Gemmataceae bacterium]|nr:hypothetical protein [Gemmataceae bacterium]
MNLSDRERATVLAALREWQGILTGNEPAEEAIDAIASDGGRFAPLTVKEVDELCERLNTERRTP